MNECNAERNPVSNAPGYDTLRFLRVGGTQICDLCCFKLRQLWLSSQNPVTQGGGSLSTFQSGKARGDRHRRKISHSRTADAESVVLNLANVLTYSKVLLYTLMGYQHIEQGFQWLERCQTDTVSGASLSLFSSRYLTSEIRRQPALLNSEERC